jgi:phosphoglycerate dehydrogenase-like enzyme
VGLGKVGRQLLSLLQPFDFNILIYSKYFPEEKAAAMKAKKVSLSELMSESNVITLHAANIPENRNMINRELLSKMKDGAVLINTSRGDLIDEKALVDELRTGRIYACLDVFTEEPPPRKSEFYKLQNCIITPHIAGSINQECYRLGHQVLRALKNYLAGKELSCEVRADMIDKVA